VIHSGEYVRAVQAVQILISIAVIDKGMIYLTRHGAES
jgi:hypothetical protein